MAGQGPRIELDECGNARIKIGITGLFRVEPHMGAPGLELVGGEDTPDSLDGDSADDALVNQGAGQLGTIPLRQRPPEVLRPLARHLHQMDGDLGWKKKASGPGPPYRISRRGRACESVRPICR